MHKPEEVKDMNDLRTGFLQRHRKRLYNPIDLASPPAKKACPDRGGEDPTAEAPLSAAAHPNEAGSSAAAGAQPNAVGSDTAATVQAGAPGPSSTAIAESDTTAQSNASVAVETRG